MRIFLLICLSILLAQPVFAKESIAPEASPNAREQIEDLLGQENDAKKEPQNLYEYADEYNQRCLKSTHPIFAGKDLERLCSCASSNIPDAMTLQNMKDAGYKTSEGYFQRTRLIMFAYKPCLEKSLYRMLASDCINNIKNKAFMKNILGTCDCIATDVSKRMHEVSGSYIRAALKNKWELIHPLDVLINPDEFNRQMRFKTKICLRIHEGIF